MKKLMMGVTAVVVCAGCSSDPESTAKTMDFLGTVAAVAIEASQPPPPPPPPAVIVQQPVMVAQPALVAQPVVVAQPAVVQPPVVAAAPAVAVPQPAVSVPQPAVAVPQPVVTPPPAVAPSAVSASPAPAAPPSAAQAAAPALPAAAAPAAPALPAAATSVRTTATDTAEPECKYGSLVFKKPATPEQIAAAKAKLTGRRVGLVFEKGADAETVAAALAQCPEATTVRVRDVKGVALAGFASLRNVTDLELHDIENLDLAPLAGLPALRNIGLYGSQVKDFSPLASCPNLDRVYYYAVKTTPEGYASLGTLKQVKKFHGGLTKMTSLEWLRQVPQAEELKVFAEKFADLTPIQALPNLTYLRCWNMKGDNLSTPLGDLAFLAHNTKLRTLELPGCRFTNTAVLAGLPALEKVDFSGAKEPVDVAFAAKLPKLRLLNLRDCQVVNGAVLGTLPKTVRVTTSKKTTGLQ